MCSAPLGCLGVIMLAAVMALPGAVSAPDVLPPLKPPPPPVPPVALEDADERPDQGPSCEEARLKCAYRTGCGRALQAYIVGCSSLHHGPPGHCPEACQQALIALTSTDEGKDLMTCQCADDLCEETKRRVEVCRPAVTRATRNETVVSCRVAQWICGADALCSTALDYYHRYCRAMFRGHKCTHRCKNSISILRRQEKAAKLDSCWCDGREDYDCPAIRTNMARLCFHQEPPRPPVDQPGDVDTNELLPKQPKGAAGLAGPGLGVAASLLVAVLLSASGPLVFVTAALGRPGSSPTARAPPPPKSRQRHQPSVLHRLRLRRSPRPVRVEGERRSTPPPLSPPRHPGREVHPRRRGAVRGAAI